MLLFKKKSKKKELEKEKEIKKAPKIKEVEKLKVEKKVVPVKEKIAKPLRADIKIASTVLIRPVITEKATDSEAKGCYTFEVNPKANKILIKQAIKELYNVKPIRVNIIKVSGKRVRYGRSFGRTKSWKKALVFLKKGDKLHFMEKP